MISPRGLLTLCVRTRAFARGELALIFLYYVYEFEYFLPFAHNKKQIADISSTDTNAMLNHGGQSYLLISNRTRRWSVLDHTSMGIMI